MTTNVPENFIQLTFHFVNGQSESFNIRLKSEGAVSSQSPQQALIQVLNKPWCILQLPEQTVCIKTANVLKIEVKPALHELQGEGVFPDARRVTALTRSSQR